jgi:hypothetical protein
MRARIGVYAVCLLMEVDSEVGESELDVLQCS